MPVITYTAKREIEKLAYAKSGTDISVAAADDSFNAATTNLSGLLDNQWIETNGFANAVNNGWFQANGASTATKITQDTRTDLVTEAAGAAITIQGYVRGLNQSYSLEFLVRDRRRSAQTIRKQHESLGGNLETLRHRHKVLWSIDTEFLLPAVLPQWREFIHSVDGGETFTFDPTGTIAVPAAPVSCVLDDDGYTEEYIGKGARYFFSLKFREV